MKIDSCRVDLHTMEREFHPLELIEDRNLTDSESLELTIFFDSLIENPCNNGTCQNNAQLSSSFTCLCNTCYTGQYCTERIEKCENVVCSNGGTCQTNDICTNYECLCAPNFTGRHCESIMSQCEHAKNEENFCKNDSICIDFRETFACQCQGFFTGNFCEIQLDPCGSSPCLNGSCIEINNGASYQCDCDFNYYGVNCEEIFSYCVGNECSEHGICVSKTDDYSCVCDSGWIGKFCDVEQFPCESDPCLHGDCIHLGNNRFRCDCIPGVYTKAQLDPGELYCTEDKDECMSFPCFQGRCTEKMRGEDKYDHYGQV